MISTSIYSGRRHSPGEHILDVLDSPRSPLYAFFGDFAPRQPHRGRPFLLIVRIVHQLCDDFARDEELA